MWFDRSARFDYDHGRARLEVSVPNRFVADWIGRHFEQDLTEAAHHELGQPVGLSVRVDPTRFPAGGSAPSRERGREEKASIAVAAPTHRASSSAGRSRGGSPGLSARHRLEDFVVGPNNELAYAAAVRMANAHQGHTQPLFLYGGVGLGKTHLLQGVCHRLVEQQPEARVLYTTAEQFTNEFLTAVRGNGLEAFRRKYRRLELLAIDDVHFIANKQATQQEFLHSFDAIELSGARIVLASDHHPKQIQQFSEALVSRCVHGLVVEVKAPDTSTRLRIIQALARRRGVTLMETVVAVLAQRCTGSVREIEGALTKLSALAELGGDALGGLSSAETSDSAAVVAPGQDRPIGHVLVNRMFGAASRPAGRPVRMSQIVEVVGKAFELSPQQVTSESRSKTASLARGLVVHLCRQMTPMSYPEIAAALGRASHSTVLTAGRRIDQKISRGEPVVLPATLETVSLGELVERCRREVLCS